MRRDATVISIDQQAASNGKTQQRACVELEHVNQCLRCSRGQGCGVANLSSSKLRLNVGVEQGVDVEVGQRLVIAIDDENSGSAWLWAVLGAYGLPLAGMLLATAAASVLWDKGGADHASRYAELSIVVSAGAGLFAGLVAWRLSSRRLLQMSERSLCLSSARIVLGAARVASVNQPPVAPIQHWK